MPGRLEPLSAAFPAGVTGLFTTRAGGRSAPPWASLNLAFHVDDDAVDVRANRDLLAEHLASPPVRFVDQVHGTEVVIAEPGVAAPVTADAVVTVAPGVAVGILVADCLPVLLADPVRRVVAAAHAGRRGLAGGVLQNTVAAMAAAGSAVADCVAVIGPGVCGRCYEVPEPMREEVAAIVPETAGVTRQGTPSLDLAAGAAAVLRRAGVGLVRNTAICTMTDDRFYSYRRDHTTGRFAGVVMLDPA